MTKFKTTKCDKCGTELRIPIDPHIRLVACVCGYYTEVKNDPQQN